MTGDDCITDEKLAAYIDRPPHSSLSLAERRQVDRHLATCPRCAAVVAGTIRTLIEILGGS